MGGKGERVEKCENDKVKRMQSEKGIPRMAGKCQRIVVSLAFLQLEG